MSFNQDKAYWTYKDEFIEKEWQLMKKAHENGIMTEGSEWWHIVQAVKHH